MILIREQKDRILYLESTIATCNRLGNAGKGTDIYLVKRMHGYIKSKRQDDSTRLTKGNSCLYFQICYEVVADVNLDNCSGGKVASLCIS